MKLAKKIAAIAACLAIATASMGIVVSAANVNPGTIYRPSDFLSYAPAPFYGTYSALTAQVRTATLSTTNSDYRGSQKYVFYATYYYGENGQKVTQSADSDWTTNPAGAGCSVAPLNAATAERIYQGRLYQTNSNSSPVVDTYFIDIRK